MLPLFHYNPIPPLLSEKMKKFKLKLWLTLAFIGILGVASLLLSDIPLDNLPKEVTDVIPRETLKLLILINPTLIVLIITGIGTLVYNRVNLSSPLIEKFLNRPEQPPFSTKKIVTWGMLSGVTAGLLLAGISKIFTPFLPTVLTDTSQENTMSLVTKVMYGGITEELMMRFGLMSLLTWLLFRATKKLNTVVYWIAIILASLIFALGHFPMLFQMVTHPSALTYAYILIGNCVGGLIFGYVYWKKGLESAFISHAMTHVTMVLVSLL